MLVADRFPLEDRSQGARTVFIVAVLGCFGSIISTQKRMIPLWLTCRCVILKPEEFHFFFKSGFGVLYNIQLQDWSLEDNLNNGSSGKPHPVLSLLADASSILNSVQGVVLQTFLITAVVESGCSYSLEALNCESLIQLRLQTSGREHFPCEGSVSFHLNLQTWELWSEFISPL